MNLTVDYHTHTIYSHGKGTILENALSAKNLGLKEIAITDHGYAHHAFGIKQKKLPEMKKLCKEAQEITGVKVLLGVEANILGISGKTDMKIEDYEWYLKLRKYGTCPRSGFGIGFDRLLMYLTGIESIKDVIPYPRSHRSCDY